MQKKQSKNSKRNIGEIWKIWPNKNMRKEHSEGENYQKGLQQENYSDGQTNSTTKNIGEDWREIGDSRKENN